MTVQARPGAIVPPTAGIDNTRVILDVLFADVPDVVVAGDLPWYPREGSSRIHIVPGVMVVFGRPKGRRCAYEQWNEGGLAPQVVLDVRSPDHRFRQLLRRFCFYERHAVEEFYLFDPEHGFVEG
jgi:Uma2 family endonuclease